MKDILISALYTEMDDCGSIEMIRDYEEAGILTNDEGLVVTLPNGEEYQITIVRSR